jgi:hypothetical protein
LDGDKIRFHWKDYAHGGTTKTMTLKVVEFLRRFLLHVLPSGFVRIRHYGLLANRVCREKLALCRALLRVEASAEPVAAEPVSEPPETLVGEPPVRRCPVCGVGQMVVVEILRAIPVNRAGQEPIPESVRFDTS